MKKLLLILIMTFVVLIPVFCTDLYDCYKEYKKDGDINRFENELNSYIESDYFKFLQHQNQDEEFTSQVMELKSYITNNKSINDNELHELIIKIQSYSIKSFQRAEKLYQYLLLAVSVIAITLLFLIIIFVKIKKRLVIQKLEYEKDLVASSTLISVQEGERKRIYQDLHDTVVQIIRVNLMNIHKLEENLLSELSEENRRILSKISKTEEQSLNEIKTIINNLTPPELEETDFRSSVRGLCNNLSEESDIPCSVYIQPEIDFDMLSDDYKLHIYRIIQEGITNAIKHSGADEISIIIKKSTSSILLFITDDGVGMEHSDHHDSGLGLKGIKNRCQFMNGSLIIKSDTQGGTELRIEIPF